MLFKAQVLDGIRAGTITLAFRRWTRPSVRAGGMLRTAAGVLAFDEVAAVRPEDISDEDARQSGFPTRDALLADLPKDRDGTLYRIAFHVSGPDPRKALRGDKRLGAEDLSALRRRLADLDRKSRSGLWAMEALRLIGERDGRTAAEIAEGLGVEKRALKHKIRLLKELGLTESLQSGYRLSDRGRVVCEALSGKS